MAGAPAQQAMPETTLSTLHKAGGLVIRQESQWSEVIAQSLGVPFEAKNKYKVRVQSKPGRHSVLCAHAMWCGVVQVSLAVAKLRDVPSCVGGMVWRRRQGLGCQDTGNHDCALIVRYGV